MLNNRKNINRIVSLVTAFSVVLMFLMPFISVIPIQVSAAPHIDPNYNLLITRKGDSAVFDNVQTTPLGNDLSGKITDVSINGNKSNSISINSGSITPALLSLALSYDYSGDQLASSGILDSHCVSYQLDTRNIEIKQDYFGNGMQVIDANWNESEPSGYYSISTDGLIVIRFTDNYIAYLQENLTKQGTGFGGSIAFDGIVNRADNADGDRNFTYEGHQVEVRFDDAIPTMTKYGASGRDANGQYVQWNITIQNPSGYIDMSEYTLTDSIKDTDESNNESYVDWNNSITDLTVNPSGAATKSGNGFTLSGNAEEITISYKQRAASGHSYENTASLEKSGQTPITVNPTVKIENALDAKKSGTADYSIYGRDEKGKIRWEIDVNNKSGDDLQEVKITDSSDFPADTKVYYYDSSNQLQELDSSKYSISGNVITLNSNCDKSQVKVIYETDVPATFSNGQVSVENKVSVESEKTDNPPRADKWDDNNNPNRYDNTSTVNYQHQYRMEKSCSEFSTETDMLQWKIEVYADSNASLNGYTITDDAITSLGYDNNQPNGTYVSFNAFSDGGYTNITDNVTLEKSGNTVTVKAKDGYNGKIGKVEIFYQQSILNNVGQTAYDSYMNGQPVTVSNDATGQKPGAPIGESATGTRQGQKRVEASKAYLSNANDKAVGNADVTDRILDWRIDLINDSGLSGSSNTVTDTLQSDNGGKQYITPSQAADFVITGRTSVNDNPSVISSDKYTITFYDANGQVISDFANGSTNAVKFDVSFTNVDNIRYISIAYETTAEVKDVVNGNTAHYNNSIRFHENTTPKDGLTFVREDPNDVKNIKLSVQKVWDDSNNKFNKRPNTYTVQIWRAEADANGNAPAADAENTWVKVGEDHTIPSTQTNMQLADDLPQWKVETDPVTGVQTVIRYCYKIVEVPGDSDYYISNISAPIVASFDTTMNLTNKLDQDIVKSAVNESGTEINNISISQVPKKTVQIDGTDTECYIFGWKIYFKEGELNYTDTLPQGAVFINKNVSGLTEYAPRVIYNDYGNSWELETWNLLVSQSGNTLSMEIASDKRNEVKAFQYYTAIPVSDIDSALQDGKLINSVQVTNEQTLAQASLTVDMNAPVDVDHLEKGNIPTIVGGTAKYYMDINPTSKKLSNEDYITITDELKLELDSDSTKNMDDLNIVLDSINVFPYNGDDPDRAHPIEDFSYTVDYDVTEEKNLTFNKINDNVWEIIGWSPGDDIEVTVLQNENLSANAIISAVPEVAGTNYEEWRALKKSIPAFSNGQSTVSLTVPEFIHANDNIDYEVVKLVVYDKGQYGGGNSPYTISDISEVKAKKNTPVVLNVDVPDQQHVRVEYTYHVTGYTASEQNNPNSGDKIYLTNTASFTADNGSGWDQVSHNQLNVQSSSAQSHANKYPKIHKVDINNYSLNTLNAAFKVAKYDHDASKWVYASEVRTDTTNNNSVRSFIFPTSSDSNFNDYLETVNDGKHYAPQSAALLRFASEDDLSTIGDKENCHDFNLGTELYKFVEVEAPADYIQPDGNGSLEDSSDFVFYYAYNGYSGAFPDDVTGSDGKSKVRNIAVNGTINIPNSKFISIEAQKTFTGDDNDIPDTATVKLKIYYSTNRNGTNLKAVTQDVIDEQLRNAFVNPQTVLYDKQNNSIVTYEWKGLPSGINGVPVYYFVQEEEVTYGGNTYTLDSSDGKLRNGSEECKFQPVFTRNGTNKDGTIIEVNNSEGITVKKLWQDSNGSTVAPPNEVGESQQKMSVQFEVYGIKDNTSTLYYSGTLEAPNYQLILPSTFNGHLLSEYDNYEIMEKLTAAQSEALGEDWTSSSTRKINNGTGTLELINIRNVEETTKDVSVHKVWEMNGSSVTHPDSVTVRLIQSSESGLTVLELQSASSTINWGEGNSGQAAQTLDDSNNWSYTWSGLPKADSSNNPYYYYVIETSSLNRYTASYNTTKTSNSSQNTVITNTFKTVNLKIQKLWNDNGETKDHSGETIQFVIKRSTNANDIPNGGTQVITESIVVAGKTFTVSASSASVYQGEEINLTATLDDDNVTSNRNTTFKVNGTAINNPYSNNTPGTYTITAEYVQGGKTYTQSIDVTVQRRGVQLNNGDDNVNVAVGNSSQLKVSFTDSGTHSDVTYSSSNTSIATVDTSGNVTGVGVGTADITVTDAYGNSDTITVNVTAAAPSDNFTLDGQDTVLVGQVITVTPSDTRGGITYSVTDTDPNTQYDATFNATTGSDGKWTALLTNQGSYVANKTVTLTATRGNCTQTKVISVGVQGSAIGQTLNSGDKLRVTLHGNPNDTVSYNFGLKDSNANWATKMEKSGSVTLDASGNGVVEIDIDNNNSTVTHIQLWNADKQVNMNQIDVISGSNTETSLSLTPKTQSITVDGNVTFTPTITNGSGTVLYSVSLGGSDVTNNSNKVTISGDTITFKESGTYTVTASVTIKGTTYTDSSTITVSDGSSSQGQSLSSGTCSLSDTVENGKVLKVVLKGTANTYVNGCLGGNDGGGTWHQQNYSGNTDNNGDLIVYITAENDYMTNVQFQAWNGKDSLYLMSYEVLDSIPQQSNLTSARFKGLSLTPYYSEFSSTSDQQPRSKRSSRPLRGGDITKTVGAESKNSEVTELFFNTNVSDIIELGAGKIPDVDMSLAIVGGKVKITSRKKSAADNEWTKIISNLPATDENGDTYYYWIEEINVPSGYTASYTNNSVNADEANGTTPEITITNTYVGDSVMLPSSGGRGSKMFSTAGGIIILLSAAGYLQFKRRRWLSE